MRCFMKTGFVRAGVLIVVFLSLVGQEAFSMVKGNCAESIGSSREVIEPLSAAGAARDGYVVREIRYGAAAMREYITPSGVVFGIDWKGMIRPAVNQLLGSVTNGNPEDLPRQMKGGGRTEDIVVQKWGSPAEPQGRAYMPELAPAGIKMEHIWLPWPA
jgi:hypothetical protein